MSRCPTFPFHLSIMSKWLAKHKSTKVSFKFTIRKRHVYIDIGCPWIWNQYLYLGIWNDVRTKIIVLPSFQLVKWINSEIRNENVFINVFILYMNIRISNWRNWSFVPTNIKFFTLFQFLPRFLTSKYLNLVSKFLVAWNGTMWKTCFSALQKAKMKISWNIKTKTLQTFNWQLGLREWRFILVITRWAHNSQTFTSISKKLWEFENFFYT